MTVCDRRGSSLKEMRELICCEKNECFSCCLLLFFIFFFFFFFGFGEFVLLDLLLSLISRPLSVIAIFCFVLFCFVLFFVFHRIHEKVVKYSL